jgi:hypothetical protein
MGQPVDLRNDISSTLKVEVYDEKGHYEGTVTLTRKK